MQEPVTPLNAVQGTSAQELLDLGQDSVSVEQATQNLLAEEGIEIQSRAVQESIAKFHFVQQLTAKRTMRNNIRRTQILAGNEKLRNLLNRFTV